MLFSCISVCDGCMCKMIASRQRVTEDIWTREDRSTRTDRQDRRAKRQETGDRDSQDDRSQETVKTGHTRQETRDRTADS